MARLFWQLPRSQTQAGMGAPIQSIGAALAKDPFPVYTWIAILGAVILPLVCVGILLTL